MSRSLLAFLLFCLGLVGVSAALVWHLGPTLVGILVDQDRRAAPYHVLRILPRSDSDTEDVRARRARVLALAAEDSGSLIWQGGALDVVEGPVRLDGATLQVLTFASGGGVVQFLTRSEYRTLAAAAAWRTYGTVTAPGELPPGRASVLVLFHAKPGSGDAPLGAPGEGGWLELASRHRGELRWQAAIDAIEGANGWNRLVMLQFPEAAAARDWLDEPATKTERALAARYVDDMVVLLVQDG